ncbi:MAG: metallophosphoesterase [Clostridiales bacterium]|jgi:predicted MPP superfamily phosphohydrolase|nr:metallophosphoesterase [Clostridiales bacterium]
MKMVLYLIVSIILAVYGGINYYIGLWIWKHLGNKLPFLNVKVYWTVFSLLGIVSLVGVGLNHYLPHFLRNGVYLIAYYWLTSVFYFTLSIVIIQLISRLDRWLGFIPENLKNTRIAPYFAGLLVLATVCGLLIYGTINASNLKITSYDISIPKQAGSLKQLRVAFLSDTHLSGLDDKNLAKLVEAINKINPDIVLISGDIIDANRDTDSYEQRKMEEYFAQIKSKYGIYASLGNHDYDFTGDSAERIDRFKQAGVNILRDSSIKIDNSFYILGREDKTYERVSGQKRKELSSIVQNMDMELPVIILDHQPISLEEANKVGADLQLSGHTHSGQMFPINLITDKIFEVDYGYLSKEGLQVIVTSGARTWGPPVRIGSPSEIVVITIQFE